MNRYLPTLIAGIAAPLLYVAIVGYGASVTPGYTRVANAISELTQPGAPGKALLDPLFAFYNVPTLVFALGLRGAFRERGVELARACSVAIVAVGIAGLLMWAFPQDPVGSPVTVTGVAHLVLASVESLGSLLAIFLMAMSLRRYPDWRGFVVYCYATLAVVALSGVGAALAAATRSGVMGLVERVTIGVFLLWMLVTSLSLLLAPRQKPA